MAPASRRLAAWLAAFLLAAPLEAQKQAASPPRTSAPASQDAGCPADPGNRSICFSRIEAEYSILRSGDVMVTERHTVRFNGEWNGMTRELVGRATLHDFRDAEERDASPRSGYRDVDIEVLGATDAEANELRIETERSGADLLLRIWVPGATDAERTVILRYRIEDGVTFFADRDEFYWNALGSTSTAPVLAMEARVIPPEGVTGLRADAFAGADGSRERAAMAAIEGVTAVARTTEMLGPGRGFTIVAGWDPGVVERPGALDRLFDWIARNWSFALPLVSLGLMGSLWRRRGRDPAMLPIVTQYEPAAGISPGEMGTLLDERADMRDVTATLVDLAVQGHLRIEEIDGTKVFGMEFGEDYRFVKTAPGTAAGPMRPHETRLYHALFDGRDQVELSDLKNEFYKDLPAIREAMMECLVSQGVYTSRPDRARAGWLVAAALLGVGLFFLLGFLEATAAAALLAVPIATALPVAVFGWLMPARTVKGTRTIERLLGFREFLDRVDGDRLRRMSIDPSAFERLLPFAMALGVERKWGEAFEGLAQQPPRWYSSNRRGAFQPALFTSELGRMSSAAASTMSSRPRSSGSGGSGFGGGGSVGGGGGGGGVGGF